MRKELLEGLTEEQIKRINECKSSEEILEYAKEEGLELNEELLEVVSGGGDDKANTVKCDYCGSANCEMYKTLKNWYYDELNYYWRCKDCGKEWIWK